MVTGITLFEGPYDGIPMNLEVPIPTIILINGHIYYQKDEEKPDRYEYVSAVDVSDRLPTEEDLAP